MHRRKTGKGKTEADVKMQQQENKIVVDRREMGERMKKDKVAFTLLGPTFRSRYSRSFFSCM